MDEGAASGSDQLGSCFEEDTKDERLNMERKKIQGWRAFKEKRHRSNSPRAEQVRQFRKYIKNMAAKEGL